MDTSIILYKGLVGSYLYNCNRVDSDKDYFIIVTEYPQMSHRVTTPEGDVIDYFWETPYIFMRSLFDDHPLNQWQVNVLERLFAKNTEEFINPLGKWLCDNRLAIVDTNRCYFGKTLLWRAKNISSSEANLYTHPPKVMVKALLNLYTYMNFASCDQFIFGSLTEKQLQTIISIQENKYSNFEVFQILKETLNECKQYETFWNEPKDIAEQKRLNESMKAVIKALVGEEPSECQD